jgi:hypothetical protein
MTEVRHGWTHGLIGILGFDAYAAFLKHARLPEKKKPTIKKDRGLRESNSSGLYCTYAERLVEYGSQYHRLISAVKCSLQTCIYWGNSRCRGVALMAN